MSGSHLISTADKLPVKQQCTKEAEVQGPSPKRWKVMTSTATSRNSESCAPEDAGLIQGGTIASEDSDTQEHRRKRIRVKSPNKEDEDDGILEEGLIEGLVGRDLFPWRQVGFGGSIIVNKFLPKSIDCSQPGIEASAPG